MNHKSLEITVVSISQQLYDIDTASQLTGIHPELINEYENGRLVQRSGSDGAGEPLFDESGICRLRILSDLRDREKLSLRMMRVVCQLMNRLERAESEIRFLRNQGK